MKRIALVLLSLALAGCGSPDSAADADGESPDAVTIPEDAVAMGKVDLTNPAVGYAVTTESTGAARGTSSVAVVGALGDAWRVELENSSLFPGLVMGLVVDKASGRVTHAVLGKPGGKGQEIPIAEVMPVEKRPDGIKEEVVIAMGSFAAIKRFESSGTTTWTGTGGELKDVLLKSSSDKTGPYELAKMPASRNVIVGDAKLAVTTLTYTDGSERWSTEDPVVKALNHGLFKTTVSGPISWSTIVVGVKTDQKPRLDWE